MWINLWQKHRCVWHMPPFSNHLTWRNIFRTDSARPFISRLWAMQYKTAIHKAVKYHNAQYWCWNAKLVANIGMKSAITCHIFSSNCHCNHLMRFMHAIKISRGHWPHGSELQRKIEVKICFSWHGFSCLPPDLLAAILAAIQSEVRFKKSC